VFLGADPGRDRLGVCNWAFGLGMRLSDQSVVARRGACPTAAYRGSTPQLVRLRIAP
jgi:hypothetical protein